MKKLSIVVAVALYLAFGGPLASARAQVKSSGVTMDTPMVTDLGTGSYKIVVTGTLSLGQNDTFNGYKFWFEDPNGKEVAPIVTKYTQPDPGKTTDYSFYTTTGVKGVWTASAAIYYTQANGTPATAAVSKGVNVPPGK